MKASTLPVTVHSSCTTRPSGWALSEHSQVLSPLSHRSQGWRSGESSCSSYVGHLRGLTAPPELAPSPSGGAGTLPFYPRSWHPPLIPPLLHHCEVSLQEINAPPSLSPPLSDSLPLPPCLPASLPPSHSLPLSLSHAHNSVPPNSLVPATVCTGHRVQASAVPAQHISPDPPRLFASKSGLNSRGLI